MVCFREHTLAGSLMSSPSASSRLTSALLPLRQHGIREGGRGRGREGKTRVREVRAREIHQHKGLMFRRHGKSEGGRCPTCDIHRAAGRLRAPRQGRTVSSQPSVPSFRTPNKPTADKVPSRVPGLPDGSFPTSQHLWRRRITLPCCCGCLLSSIPPSSTARPTQTLAPQRPVRWSKSVEIS